MYISEKNRKELRDTQISLNDFIKSLEIKMSLNHIDKSQVERVAQLVITSYSIHYTKLYECVLQYNTSLFKEESMLLFTKHFSLLLEKGINSHQELIKDINVIALEEKSTIEEKRRVNINNKIKAELAISATRNNFV